ncbi:MAG: diguanylate cyclase [Granulosicoccus sp.]
MAHELQFTALVVDDEPAITELLTCILQSVDMNVIVAHDGYAAVELLAGNSVDVVVTDIRMNGMSGFDLIEHTNRIDSTIKVIMMTGYDSYDMVKKALRANAYDYLNKPLTDHDEIISTVLRACDSARLTRENRDLIDRLQASNSMVNAANKRLLQLNKQLRTLAITDSLTLLYNRRYIDEWIQSYAFSNSNLGDSYSILLLDVDYFKSVNDNLGHDGGDKVLKHLATVLRSGSRHTDVVGRYGGEEFIIVMPDTGEDEATEAAEKIRSMIEDTNINVSSGTVKITVSIGISTDLTAVTSTSNIKWTPTEAFFSGRALIAQADKALYRAKDLGRNRCVHHSQMLDDTDTKRQTG